jgi:putative phage-type endonuclease
MQELQQKKCKGEEKMYKNLIKISTIGMSRDEWLKERRKSIGGSDVSALLGMNEYCSRYTLYADKKGLLPDKEDNEAMRIGRDLEDYIAKRFTEKTGKKVRRENSIIRNPDMPYLHANIDRVVVGEDAVLECKAVSALNMKQYKNGEYPERFYAQCCEYMLVCGFKKAYLAVLILGKGFMVFEIERDEDELNALNIACKEFWNLVQTDTPPTADCLKSTSDTLVAIYPTSNTDSVNLFGYENELAQYMAISSQIKALEEQKDDIANKVKAYMQEAGKGENEHYKVSWTSSERKTFDAKAFAKDNPNLDLSKYYKVSNVRTFKVSEVK